MLSNLIQAHPGMEVFLAGGAVRDILLSPQMRHKDFDFFIDCPNPKVVLSTLKEQGTLAYGPFGSPRWFPRGQSSYVDVIFIREFYNGLSLCTNMIDVLNQFDFTANAVAVNLRTGEFLDPIKGSEDIRHRIMRGVRFDYPDEQIGSDKKISRLSVLWFRLLHYAALCKLRIEPATMNWLLAHRAYKRDLPYFSKLFFEPCPDSALIYCVNQ